MLVLKLVLVVGGLWLALSALAAIFQRHLVWIPGAPPSITPADVGLPFETLPIETADGLRLSGWLVHAEDPAGWIVVSHGNAGNIAYRLELARALRDQGFAVLLYDYRGYGGSEGRTTEEGTYRDAVAAYDALIAREEVDAGRIVAWGESLGAAVALELARRRPVRAVAIESALTSVPDLGARVYPFLPVRWLARIHYASREKVDALSVPLLVIHSPDDEIVPFAMGRELFERASVEKRFLETGGGHNDGGFLRRRERRARVGEILRGWLGG